MLYISTCQTTFSGRWPPCINVAMTDLVEATLQQQSKDQEVVSSLGMKKHQEEFLAHVQAGIRRIFGQLRSLFITDVLMFSCFLLTFLVKKIHCKKKEMT